MIAPMAMMLFCWVILVGVDFHQEGKAELESYYESRITLTPTKSLRSPATTSSLALFETLIDVTEVFYYGSNV